MITHLTPKETSDALIESAQNKITMPTKKRLLMSIMAGMYISLGGHGFLVTFENVFIRASVFPVGLMLIVIVGGELFTGNCLMTFALLQGKIKVYDYFKSLVQVLLGNFIGCLLIVSLLYLGGIYNNPALSEPIAQLANIKLSLTLTEAITRGILCNILVTLGVWFSTAAKDTTGKLLGCWFPIMLFALSGYEHIVANMFFMPMAVLLNPTISTLDILLNNFLPVTIGNFIGGGILVPVVYYKIYHK